MNRTLAAACDEMAQRMTSASHRLSGAAEVMRYVPFPWPAEVEAEWQRMSRRFDRRHAAWMRLAVARNREENGISARRRDSLQPADPRPRKVAS